MSIQILLSHRHIVVDVARENTITRDVAELAPKPTTVKGREDSDYQFVSISFTVVGMEGNVRGCDWTW